jgi:hypothetical protein
MMRRAGLALMALLLIGAAPAELRLGITNRTGAPLECHALAGHWYGFDLGVIAPGGRGEWALGLDPANLTLSLPNTLHQPIPLQNIYCGRAQDAWRTRAELVLRQLVSDAHRAEVTCRAAAGSLTCE